MRYYTMNHIGAWFIHLQCIVNICVSTTVAQSVMEFRELCISTVNSIRANNAYSFLVAVDGSDAGDLVRLPSSLESTDICH